MSWNDVVLGSAIHIKHGFAFKGDFFVDQGDYIVLTPGNFYESGGFKSRAEKDRAYAGDIPESYILNEGDLIVAMTEQGEGLLGSTALVPQSNRFLHNQRLGLIDEVDETIFDRRFLYLLLNTRSVRAQISGSATGTKVRHTAPERIYRVRATVPNVSTQSAIAGAVLAYDALIDNNRRRMALLEDSARQLYREWFVRLRFPGHEHTPIVDGVPQGWKKVRVDELGSVLTGKTPSTKDADNYGGDIQFVKTPDMHGNAFVLQTETQLTEKGAKSQANKFLPPGALLVSCIGTVGVVSLTSELCQFNQQINAVIPMEDFLRYYSYFALKDLKPRLDAIGGGVTMANVSKGKFESMDVLRPTSALLRNFDEFSSPVFNQIKVLGQQNQKLRQARDLLLPRLMNGELAV